MLILRYVYNLYTDTRKTIEVSSPHAFFQSLKLFSILRKVRRHTKVRIPRLKALYKLTETIDANHIPGDIAEFGVWRGGSGAFLLWATRSSPYKRTVWLFDSFEGYPLPTKEDEYLTKEKNYPNRSVASETTITQLLISLGIPKKRYHIMKGWFKDTFPSVTQPTFVLLHYDAGLYESTKLILETFYDRLQVGGYIVFNSWRVNDGVRRAMHEFLEKRNITLHSFPIDNGIAMGFQKVALAKHLSHNAYQHIEYNTKRRFISYWHQIHEITALAPKNFLEIGIGNGFVSDYLKKIGVVVTTCDNNTNLKPDYTASIIKLPFDAGAFDVVSAFEILEHLPYQESLRALNELRRVSSRWVVISLPDTTRVWRVEIPLPKFGKIRKLVSLPKLRPPEHVFSPITEHFWEIGKKDYPLSRIITDIQKAKFTIKNTYRVFEFPYHRFFVLEAEKLSQ